MGTIGTQIEKILEIEGLSIREFEVRIGASNGTIGRCISQEKGLHSKYIYAIAKTFDYIDTYALVSGEGDIRLKTPVHLLGKEALAYLSDRDTEINDLEKSMGSFLKAMQESSDPKMQQLANEILQLFETLIADYNEQKEKLVTTLEQRYQLKEFIASHFNLK